MTGDDVDATAEGTGAEGTAADADDTSGGAASEGSPADAEAPELPEDVPVWEDEYFDRVSDRLLANYDLEKDFDVRGRRFDLYGRMRLRSQKHFLHPSLSYAHHETTEHLFATRRDRVRVEDVQRYVDLGHDLADEWIEPDEEHYGTDFTFVVVASDLPESVRSFVSGFKDRTLIKYGYHGHYEINLVVVAPEREAYVDSASTDVGTAFALWEPVEREEKGLLRRLLP